MMWSTYTIVINVINYFVLNVTDKVVLTNLVNLMVPHLAVVAATESSRCYS